MFCLSLVHHLPVSPGLLTRNCPARLRGMNGTTTDEASECCLASGGAGPGRGASRPGASLAQLLHRQKLCWHSRRGTPRAKMGQQKRAALSREEEELAVYSLNVPSEPRAPRARACTDSGGGQDNGPGPQKPLSGTRLGLHPHTMEVMVTPITLSTTHPPYTHTCWCSDWKWTPGKSQRLAQACTAGK